MSVKSKTYNKVKNYTKFNNLNEEEKKLNFNKIWNFAYKVGKSVYKTSSIAELRNVAQDLVEEFSKYKSSILSNFMNASGKTKEEKFFEAEKTTYKERTSEFFKKYGNKIYNGHRMKTYFKDYELGKLSREELNDIIKSFQLSDSSYEIQTYRSRNYESKSSI